MKQKEKPIDLIFRIPVRISRRVCNRNSSDILHVYSDDADARVYRLRLNM